MRSLIVWGYNILNIPCYGNVALTVVQLNKKMEGGSSEADSHWDIQDSTRFRDIEKLFFLCLMVRHWCTDSEKST